MMLGISYLPNTKPEHVFCPRELREVHVLSCKLCRFCKAIHVNGVSCRYGYDQKFHVFDFFGVEGCIRAHYRRRKKSS